MYQIKETREFYAPFAHESVAIVADPLGEPEVFEDFLSAKARIKELDLAHYTLAHNESARPSYTLVAMQK